MADADLVVRATTSGFGEAKADVAGLRQEVTGANVESAAAGLKGEAGLKALQAELAATKVEAAAFTKGTAEAGVATTGLGISGVTAASHLALMALGVQLLPKLLDAVDSKTRSWAESIVDYVTGQESAVEVTKKAGETDSEYALRQDQVRKALDDRRDAQLRASAAVGAGLIQEGRNAEATALAWEVYQRALHGTLDASDAVGKALAELGIRVPESFGRIHDAAQDLGIAFEQTLKGKGVEAANVFAEANRGRLEEVITRYQRLGSAVPDALKAMAAALGLVTAVERDLAKDLSLAKKFADESLAIGHLKESLKAAEIELGSEQAATVALRGEIERHIAALEKLKVSSVEDEAARKALIVTLQNQLALHGLLTGEQAKEAEAVDKVKGKIGELAKAYSDANKTLRERLETIEKNRVAAIGASNSETATVIKNLGDEGTAFQGKYKSQNTALTDYRVSVAQHFADIAKQRQADYENEVAINRAAEDARKKAVDENVAAVQKLAEQAKDYGVSLADLKVATDGLAESQAASAGRFDDQARAARDGATAADENAAATQRNADALRDSADSAAALAIQIEVATAKFPALSGAVAGLRGELQALTSAAVAAAAAVASVTDGGGAAPGPAQ